MWRKKLKWLWIVSILVLGAVAALFLVGGKACQVQSPPELNSELNYEDFSKKLEQPGEIISVTVLENPNDDSRTIVKVVFRGGSFYKAKFPLNEYPDLSEKLEKAKVKVDILQGELIYTGFSAKLDKPGEVVSVLIQENSNKDSGTIAEVKLKDEKVYKVNFPLYLHPGLLERLEKAEVKIDVQPVSGINWVLVSFFILGLFFVFIMLRRIGSGGANEAKSFTQSRTRSVDKPVKERFSDVAGIDEVKEEVEDIVDFLKYHEKYQKIGARIPRGVLLSGPPGTGKTLLARAISGEAGVPFFPISGSEFVEMFVGVGAARVRDLFEKAKKSAPSIIFIDEIDAVGRHRGSGLGHSHDEREQTLNQIFVEMDGFDERTNVIVLAATNRPDILDPALLRPKRFDRRVTVSKPDVKGREAILKVHTKAKSLAKDVNLEILAKSLPGVTGADLENLTNEAAIIAAKKNEPEIKQAHFIEAMDKILMGKGRKLVMDENDKKLIAYHESGHAVVSKLLPGTDPVRKISITARERSLGQTLTLPEKDRYITNEQYLLNWMSICLGGRLAEEIFLGTKSTGAEDDLRKATEIAQKMVCSWGMSKLGPRAFGAKEEEIFLGREITRKEDVSPETLKAIDDEVDRIVKESYEKAGKILSENREKVEFLVRGLLEKETLEEAEIDELTK